MLITSLMMGLAVSLVLLEVRSVVVFLIAAVAYGGVWVIMPAYMASKFGKKNMVFGFTTSVLFMSANAKWVGALVGGEYDRHKSESAAFCEPASVCFRTAGWVAIGCCVVSLGVGYVFLIRERFGFGRRKGRGQSSLGADEAEEKAALIQKE